MLSGLWLALGSTQDGGQPLFVVNMSAIEHNMLPLWLSAQGTLARLGRMNVMLVGIDGSEAGQLGFLHSQYNYSAQEVAPWELFTHVQPWAMSVVLCAANDSSLALHAALTLASQHGNAAAVCVDKVQRDQVLGAGFSLLSDLSGMFPDTCATPAKLNSWVRAQQRERDSNLSTSMFATRPVQSRTNAPTAGFDFVTYRRLPVMCLDAAASDFASTQTDILTAYQPGTVAGFGWWTKEGTDIEALSQLGLSWLGGGRNLALFARLPALPPGTPQPSAELPVGPLPAGSSMAVFSFTQGDAESFNQKVSDNTKLHPLFYALTFHDSAFSIVRSTSGS